MARSNNRNTEESYPMTLARHALALAAAVLLLGACGGGGRSDSSSITPVEPHALVTTVAPASYSGDNGNTVAFDTLNTLRENIGSGLLAQNAALDRAALAHWNYVSADPNGLLKTHNESSDQPGFTGVDPTARALAAGYVGSVGELMYGINTPAAWSACAANWANSVYHASLLFSGARDIGVAAQTTPDYPPYGRYTVCVVELGLKTSDPEQLPVDGSIRVYPYAGQTDVPYVFENQTETPVPLPDYSELGTPILLNFKTRSHASTVPTVVISALSVAPASGGAALPAKVLTRSMTSTGPALTGDSNLDAYTLVLVPTARLQVGTNYRITFSGSVDGTPATKTWTFTTASP